MMNLLVRALAQCYSGAFSAPFQKNFSGDAEDGDDDCDDDDDDDGCRQQTGGEVKQYTHIPIHLNFALNIPKLPLS